MKRIYVQNGIVFFYGNPAGYLGDGKAVIDCMFQKEELVSFVKEQFLVEPVFREGVYDRLSEGGGVKETAEVSIGEGRRLRIYQLGQDSPIMMRFISLAERKKRGYDNNLWYEEVVPAKSVFFTLILSPEPNLELDFARHSIIQFGGNASIGRGFTKCSIIPMPAAQNGGAE